MLCMLQHSMAKLKRVGLLVLFAFIYTINIEAQETGSIKGYVRDGGSKELISGALIQSVSNANYGTTSDTDGSFTLLLPIGNQKLRCVYFGYHSTIDIINIHKDSTVVVTFLLKKDLHTLETIVVSSGKFEQRLEDITVSMEVIKPGLIQHKNTTSIETALEQVPGLTVIDNDPQIRGGSGFTFGVGSRVAIVVDGIPLLSGDAGRPEWTYVPVENIEQIEVIKGASSVLYGSSALNGVINIRTAYPRTTPKTQINYSAGLYSLPQAPAGNWYHLNGQNSLPGFSNLNFFHSRIIKNQLDLVVGANLNIDQGYIGPAPPQPHMDSSIRKALLLTDSIPTFDNHEMVKERARFNINLRYRSKKIEGLSYGVNTNFMYNKTNMVFAWLDDSVGLYRAYPGAMFLQNQTLFNVDPYIKYVRKNGVTHLLQTRIFYSQNDITNNQSNQGTMYFGEYQLQRKIQQLDLNFTGGVVGNISYSQSNIYNSSGQRDNKIVNASGYAQLDKKVWDILNLSAGLRYEYFKMNQLDDVMKPIYRAGANIQLTKGTFIRSSYGIGYRYPTITERYISTKAGMFGVSPNPDLKPETSNSFEIGAKQGFMLGSFKGFVDVAGFYQEYQNTIEYLFGVWDPNVSVVGFKFLNTGNSRVRGVDISIAGATSESNKRFGATLLAGYTYIDPVSLTPDSVYARDKSLGGFGQDLTYTNSSMDPGGNVLKYRFKHMFKLDVEFRIFQFGLGISNRYYSKMQNIDKALENIEVLTDGFYPNIYRIKAINFWKQQDQVSIWDVRGSYIVNSHHRLSILVNNLFNVTYSLRPMKVETPRTFSIQYILTL